MLDNLKFRKLENGYTVKYHIADDNAPLDKPSGYSKEIYCENEKTIGLLVDRLISENLPFSKE